MHTLAFLCDVKLEFMIHPVSQWAVILRTERHKRVMEIPGELLSCGLPAPRWHALSRHIVVSVCQRAHDFKGDLKHSFIFCRGLREASLDFMSKAP